MLERYQLADGGEQYIRDPGDSLWAEIFDMLLGVATTPFLPQLSRDRKGDFFELTLGAAVVVLDSETPGKRSRPILNPKP